MTTETILSLLLIGISAGLLSGLMGVGGGIIVVPALVLVLGFSQYQAQGTSLALLSIPVALGGAYNYYQGGYIEIKYVLVLGFAFLVGGYLGSVLSLKIPVSILKKIFAVLMIVIAVKILFSK
ncbi:MAG: sulfite exporter TauE/SafE family protein [Bacteroidota bacterium]|nr:sulfite exporter TauE/SafE family protein [Bacteroidota bacterium]